MARKNRNNVDYFPHPVVHGKRMFFIRKKYKNDGYTVWMMLLEKLGKADYHYLDLSDEVEQMYLSAEFDVEHEVMMDILKDLAKMGGIHRELFEKHNIIYSEEFVESIQDAYSRRSNNCVTLDDLCVHLQIKCKHKRDKCSHNDDENPQSKEEDNKVKETKGYLFDNFWDDYDKKVGPKEKIEKKFNALSNADKEAIRLYIPEYKKAQPEKRFRKNPDTFLNQKGWTDELIFSNENKGNSNYEGNSKAISERSWNSDQSES